MEGLQSLKYFFNTLPKNIADGIGRNIANGTRET